jgi:hypothetical protein
MSYIVKRIEVRSQNSVAKLVSSIAYRVYSEERKRKEIQEKMTDKGIVSSIELIVI